MIKMIKMIIAADWNLECLAVFQIFFTQKIEPYSFQGGLGVT